jgi:small subunit ribosomal protein S20
MPILKAAKKAITRDQNRRVFNDRRRRAMREEVKAFKKLIVAKDIKAAEAMMPTLAKAIDKAAKAGVIKKNTADRKKSRLSKMVTSLK